MPTVQAIGVVTGLAQKLRDQIVAHPTGYPMRYWLLVNPGLPAPTAGEVLSKAVTAGLIWLAQQDSHSLSLVLPTVWVQSDFAGSDADVAAIQDIDVTNEDVADATELATKYAAPIRMVYGWAANTGYRFYETGGKTGAQQPGVPGFSPVLAPSHLTLLPGRWVYVTGVKDLQSGRVTWLDGAKAKIGRKPNGSELRSDALVAIERRVGANGVRFGEYAPT